MPSVVPGFEYDVFISYRQNDNQPAPGVSSSEGWVSEFVKHLDAELKAVSKDPISIYFDQDPQHGLQGHHDVDDSLRTKLRALVFIPILSRTYCDESSFAFEHELKPFAVAALQDTFGMKVKVGDGNVSNRVLPVSIHEISQADIVQFENAVGSRLRALPMIFQSAGVNRPLMPGDKREENQAHTVYRDQLNKIAIAIHELVMAMKSGPEKVDSTTREVAVIGRVSRRRIGIATAILLLVAATSYWLLGWNGGLMAAEKAGIAVLPFTNNTGNAELNYLSIAMARDIRTKLSFSKSFERITALRATLPYAESKLSIPQIAEELRVDYIISGFLHPAQDGLEVEAELVEAATGKLLWEKSLKGTISDVSRLQQQIASLVLAEFSHKEKTPGPATTQNPEAYRLFNDALQLWSDQEDSPSTDSVISLFKQAVNIDSSYSDAWLGLLAVETFLLTNKAYDRGRVARIESYTYYMREHFPTQPQRILADGLYYYRVSHQFALAEKSFQAVLQVDPENSFALALLSALNRRRMDYADALRYRMKALEISPTSGSEWKELGFIYADMGDDASALKAFRQYWKYSQSKDAAWFSLITANTLGVPLDSLPELKDHIEYKKSRALRQENWPELLDLSRQDHDLYLLALTYNALDQRDSAKAVARRMIKLDPKDEVATALLGDTAKASRMVIERFAHMTESGDEVSAKCWTIFNLITLSLVANDYDKADRLLNELMRKYPNYRAKVFLYANPQYVLSRHKESPFWKTLEKYKSRPALVSEFVLDQ